MRQFAIPVNSRSQITVRGKLCLATMGAGKKIVETRRFKVCGLGSKIDVMIVCLIAGIQKTDHRDVSSV